MIPQAQALHISLRPSRASRVACCLCTASLSLVFVLLSFVSAVPALADDDKPKVKIVHVVDDLDPFSPNNDGRRDTITLHIEAAVFKGFGRRRVLEVTTTIRSSAGELVRRFTTREPLPTTHRDEDEDDDQDKRDKKRDKDDDNRDHQQMISIDQIWDGMDSRGRIAPDGIYDYKVTARILKIEKKDEDAEEKARAHPVNGSVTLDTTPPRVVLTSPAEGFTTDNATLAVAGTVRDANPITQVIGNGSAANLTKGVFSLNLNLTVGSNLLTVTATDIAGNATTVARTVSLNTFGVPTGTGSNISVSPGSGVTVTFSAISSSGITLVTANSTGPAPPAGFQLGNPPNYYNISTTATFTPPLTICLKYSPVQFGDDSSTARLFHFENNAWVDITFSNDTTNYLICGNSNSLSPFAILNIQTRVPNVVGLHIYYAGGALKSANLNSSAQFECHPTIPVFYIIRQNPVGGTFVAIGETVYLSMSSGPGSSTQYVPYVLGLIEAAAREAITAANLVVGNVSMAPNVLVLAGNVISQSPPAGTFLCPSEVVDLVVSSGPFPQSVPDVVGLTQTAAESAIKAVNLVVGTVTSQSNAAPADTVVSQSPPAGTLVAQLSPVSLWVSLGPNSVTITELSCTITKIPPFPGVATPYLLTVHETGTASANAQGLSLLIPLGIPVPLSANVGGNSCSCGEWNDISPPLTPTIDACHSDFLSFAASVVTVLCAPQIVPSSTNWQVDAPFLLSGYTPEPGTPYTATVYINGTYPTVTATATTTCQ